MFERCDSLTLPINDRFKQVISSMSFKFCNNTSPPYMNDVFKPAGQPNTTKSIFAEIKSTFAKN